MKNLRRFFAGAWLLAGAVVLTAGAGTTPAVEQVKGRKPDRAVNAPPAKGERYPDTLKVGAPAPDFTLADPTGKNPTTLSSFQGTKPVVLIFGSCTWPPFRRQSGDLERLYQAYKDKAEFLLVYIREAHPGSQIPGINDGKAIKQTDTLEERRALAAETVKELKLTMPVVVDKVDNKVNAAYAGWPDRLVIVGVDGKVAHYGQRGPGGFKPSEIEDWLKKNLK